MIPQSMMSRPHSGVVALVGLLSLALCACRPAPPIADPFLRDRTGTVARGYDVAVLAQESARRALTRAMQDLSDEALQGINPSTAYDQARRLLLRVQSRLAGVERRAAFAHYQARDMEEQWSGELRRYSDDALRADARMRLEGARAARERLDASFGRAMKALNPASTELADRTLFLKHCRDQGALRPAPVSSEALSRYAAARDELAVAGAELKAALRDYLAQLGREPTEVGPSATLP